MPPSLRTIARLAAALCLPLLLPLPLSALASAGEDDAGTEAEHLADLPVILSATRLSQASANAPGSVSVIDSQMIRASGARNLYELFALVPGFQVGRHTGNQPLVSYHGLSDEAPRRMLVQVDGRSGYSPYLISGVEWNQLGVDIDDIERIEIFRGSNSAAYGSNAFLGVANIITRSPSETLGNSIRYRTGNTGINDISMRVGRQLGDVALRLTVARQHDQGFQSINDWRTQEMASLRADWAVGNEDTVEIQAGWSNNDLGIGKDANLSDPERTMRIDTSFGLVRWHHTPSSGEELTLTWYHQEENGRDRFPAVLPIPGRQSGLPFTLALPFDFDYGFRAVRDDLEVQEIFSPHPSLRSVIGIGMRQDQLVAPQYFTTRERIGSGVTRFFSTIEWQATPEWLFNLGAMLEDNSLTGTSLAPRASANYHMTENQTLRVGINRSVRSPIAFEQKSSMVFSTSAPVVTPRFTLPAGTPISQTFRPSPGLGAERITTYELGYLAELPKWRASLDARVFLERARQLIEMHLENSSIGLLPRDNTRYFANSGKADVRGLEFAFTWRPSNDSWLSMQHTELRVDGPGQPSSGSGANPSPWVANSAPRWSSGIFGAWAFAPAWQLSVARRWIGSMSWYADDAHRIPAYRQLDLQLTRRLPESLARGEISLTGRNLDGKDQTFAPGASWWGRQVFGTLRLEF